MATLLLSFEKWDAWGRFLGREHRTGEGLLVDLVLHNGHNDITMS